MATSVSYNGTVYSIPANREARGWGTSLSAFLVDVANSSLSKSGGVFTLTADANLGATNGLVVKYIKSISSNIAADGVIRVANSEGLAWRNAANDGDLAILVSGSDRLTFGGVNIPTISSTDTLSNKTLTSPTITGSGAIAGTFTGPLTGNVTGNVSGTAANITGIAAILNGGTGSTTAQGARTAILPSQGSNSGKALTTDGTDVAWTAIVTNPMTTLGDTVYGAASGVVTRLPGQTTATKKFLRQLGNGSVSAAPSWEEVDQVKGQTVAAAAGYVGEEIVASRLASAAVAIGGSATPTDVATLVIPTAGVWQISGNVSLIPNGTASFTRYRASVSRTSATEPSSDTLSVPNSNGEVRVGTSWDPASLVGGVYSLAIAPYTFIASGSTTFYLIGTTTNTVSNGSLCGSIRAVRIA